MRRGAIYVRSGTNTREATYDQVQRLLNRRLETISPHTATTRVRRELEQLQLLYLTHVKVTSSMDPEHPHGEHHNGSLPAFQGYLEGLIEQKKALLEHALGLLPEPESAHFE